MNPLRAALAGARRAWRGWQMWVYEALARRWMPPDLQRDAAADDRELAALRRRLADDADRRADLERRRAEMERRLAAVDVEVRARAGLDGTGATGTFSAPSSGRRWEAR